MSRRQQMLQAELAELEVESKRLDAETELAAGFGDAAKTALSSSRDPNPEKWSVFDVAEWVVSVEWE